MPGGRPPKPIEEKRRTGNPGKRPLAPIMQLAVVPAIAVAPPELPVHETLEWVLEHGRQWLAQTDTTALALLRETLDERRALRELVLQLPGASESRKALRDLDKQIIAELSALGFDPAARARLGLAEVKARSKLEELRNGSDRNARKERRPKHD